MIKKLWNWVVEAVKETLNLSWTLVGLIIATLTLTGSAQQVTGLATVITLAVWLLTIGFRKEKPKGENLNERNIKLNE
mgnify:CR=1 FL=1